MSAHRFLQNRHLAIVGKNERRHKTARVIMDPHGRLFEAMRTHLDLVDQLEQDVCRTYILTDVPDEGDSIMMSARFLRSDSVVVVTYRYDDLKKWLRGVLLQLASAFERREDRDLKRLIIENDEGIKSTFLQAAPFDGLEIGILSIGHNEPLQTLVKSKGRVQ